ncbi:MAG: ABC transporter ATP-binding protein [SAR324 cluster bacterium]|nr:ABC transporter ATP-binding protein [SAR324 cluster bacterium]
MTDPKTNKLLQVTGLTKSFGGIKALQDMSLDIKAGELVALIGPNGAGKTTFFNCLTGMYQADHGQVQLKGNLLKGLKPSEITQVGIARTFQNIRLFDQLTVIENVLVGCHASLQSTFIDAIFRTTRHKEEEEEAKEKSYQLLEKLNLLQHAQSKADSLPYADQRRLEIARALATEPKLLLLDEPAAGMNHSETAELDQLILQLKEEFGLGILLIEHDMKLVMKISDRIFVMDRGAGIAVGTPSEIRANKKVIAAYLGEEIEEDAGAENA